MTLEASEEQRHSIPHCSECIWTSKTWYQWHCVSFYTNSIFDETSKALSNQNGCVLLQMLFIILALYFAFILGKRILSVLRRVIFVVIHIIIFLCIKHARFIYIFTILPLQNTKVHVIPTHFQHHTKVKMSNTFLLIFQPFRLDDSSISINNFVRLNSMIII